MKAGWEVKPLGKVISVTSGFAFKSADYCDNGHFLVRIGNVQDGELVLDKPKFVALDAKTRRFELASGDVLTSLTGNIGRVAVVEEQHLPAALNQRVARLSCKHDDNIDERYFLYFLYSDGFGEPLRDLSHGAAQQNVSPKAIADLEFPIPPLEEQKRIVAVLDAAFEGLTRAKENAKANLQNARDLFEASQAKLLSDAGGGWFRKTISDCFKLKSGDGLTAKAMVHGEYAVYGGNGVAGHHNASNLTGENVIIGRVGALCGNARLIETDIWLTDNAFLVTDFQHDFDLPFLTFMLNFMNLRSFARQTAQPVISNSSLKDVVLSFPESRSTQTDIALKLLEIENEVEGLETNYRTKLTDISDLRQSLLQKAFAGELT